MSDYQQQDLVIRKGHVITMDADGTRYQSADISINKGVITGIGCNLKVKGDVEINANGNAVLPGLINCHTHETLLRGLAEDLPLMRWLDEICFPKDRAFQAEHQRAAALMTQLELIRGGTTTFIDIFRYPDEAAKVAENTGLRAIFSPQLIDEPSGAGETLESSIAFIEKWNNRVPGRIYTWFGPHAPYSCTKETFLKIVELAEFYNVGIHTHLAESHSELEQFMAQYGKTSVHFLDELGVLNPRLLVAHAVHLNDKEIELLARRDVAVAYNPTSNMKLASGVARIPELIRAGVRVGLGTDSNLSNNNLDMFEEMRVGAMLQKLWRKDAQTMPCEQMLRMATIDAAVCLGLHDQVGSLEIGKRADIIIVDLHAPHMWPVLPEPSSNIVEQLVYSASAGDVLTTIVDGEVLMRDREFYTLDEQEIEKIVHEAAIDLIRISGIDSIRGLHR